MKKIFSLLLTLFVFSCQGPNAYADYKGPIYTVASYYSEGYRTANGERFNPNGLTCAHKYLPFNTRLLIRYGNRSAICRVNDRGPFIQGRGLDLSLGMARQLGILNHGVVRVSYTIL